MLQKVEHAAIYLACLAGNNEFPSETDRGSRDKIGQILPIKTQTAFDKKWEKGIDQQNWKPAVSDKKGGRSQDRPPREKPFAVEALFVVLFLCPISVDHRLENSPCRFVLSRIISWWRDSIFGVVERNLVLDYARQIVIFF